MLLLRSTQSSSNRAMIRNGFKCLPTRIHSPSSSHITSFSLPINHTNICLKRSISSKVNVTNTTYTQQLNKQLPFTKKGVRVALIIQDLQNNVVLIQNKMRSSQAGSAPTSDTAEEAYVTQIPSISMTHNQFNRVFDDPREAINTYLENELLIEVEQDKILPFTQFYTDPQITDEQILIYFVKVKRYYENDDEEESEVGVLEDNDKNNKMHHHNGVNGTARSTRPTLQHFSIDQIVTGLCSNIYSDPIAEAKTDVQRRKQINLVDAVTIASMGKFIVDRQEHIFGVREHFVKIRYAVLSFLLGSAVTAALLGSFFL